MGKYIKNAFTKNSLLGIVTEIGTMLLISMLGLVICILVLR